MSVNTKNKIKEVLKESIQSIVNVKNCFLKIQTYFSLYIQEIDDNIINDVKTKDSARKEKLKATIESLISNIYEAITSLEPEYRPQFNFYIQEYENELKKYNIGYGGNFPYSKHISFSPITDNTKFSDTCVSLNEDGTIIAVLSQDYNKDSLLSDYPGIPSTGYIAVFQYIDNFWTKIGENIDNDTNDLHSISMNLKGNTIAIGFYNKDLIGIVKVYNLTNNVWLQKGTDINGVGNNDYNGWSVSLSGDGNTVLCSLKGVGKVKIFEYENDDWTEESEFSATGEDYGYAVSLSKSSVTENDSKTLIIGAPLHESSKGRVEIIKREDTTNTVSQIIGDEENDKFGFSVAINSTGNLAIIGAPGYQNNRGYAALYKLNNNIWRKYGDKVIGDNEGDQMGYSVSINSSGNIVSLGSIGHSNNKGFVRVFRIPE